MATTATTRLLYEARFPAETRFVGPTRRTIVDVARGAGTSEVVTGDVSLAVSEALTNGVMHAFAGRNTGCVSVQVQVGRDGLTVAVSDDGVGMVPRSDSPGLGMGLDLIRRVCRRCDVRPGPDGVGTTVRMTFPLA